MAYTRVWDNNNVTGSTQAAAIDTGFQAFRGDLQERLEDKFVTSIVADPWVVKPEILGNVVGKKLHLHHSAFKGLVSTINDQYIEANTSTGTDYWTPIIIPVGDTVQSIKVTIDRQGKTVQVKFGYVNPTTGAFVSVGTLTDNASVGVTQMNFATGLPHVIVVDRMYMFTVNLGGSLGVSSRLYGAIVTYDTPDCRNTL